MLYNDKFEHVWRPEGPCTARSHIGGDVGSVGVPCKGGVRARQGTCTVKGGSCMLRSNASWIMVTWDLCGLKTLPSHKFGWRVVNITYIT